MPIAYECRHCKGPPLPHEWEGACPNCGGFYRAIRKFVRDGEVDGAELASVEDGVPISAGDLMTSVGGITKIETGLRGFDWITNGGLPRFGGAILLGAEAGAGKSSWLLFLLRTLAALGIDGMYISSEQQLLELAQQFSWMGRFPSKHMLLHHAKKKDDIVSAIEKNRASVYAVDSLHEVTEVVDPDGYSLATGNPTAIAQIGRELKPLAADRQGTIFAVGHVNTDGTIAGGTRIRHMLDGTLMMRYWPGLTKAQQEKDPRRILQFEGKTRFGPRGRRALVMMRSDGLTDEGPLDDEEVGDGDEAE